MEYTFFYLPLTVIVICVIVIAVLLYGNSKKSNQNDVPSSPSQSEATPSLPQGYAVGNNNLPYKTNKVYGWGKEYNVFITRNGKHFHRSRCKMIKNNQKSLMHRYNAIKNGYIQCKICKPKNYIDDWYKKEFPSSEYAQINNAYEQISLFD